MKCRSWTPVLLLVLAGLAACGADPELVVEARVDGRPVANLPVRLLPYDRAAILDSLAAAAPEPEPAIPPGLIDRLRSLDAGGTPVNLPGDSTALAGPALRDQLRARADSVREGRRAWAERTFAPFEEIAERRREESEREELADTTDASGRAAFRIPPGRWWVSAQYRLPYSELRWNVPVRTAGDSTTVPLTAQNAAVRPSP